MENSSYKLRNLPNNWENTYKNLKHTRYIRNKLAHDVGAFDLEICSQEDINWLKSFYNSVLSVTDPLATMNKILQKEKIIEKPKVESKNNNNNQVNFFTKIKNWFIDLFN